AIQPLIIMNYFQENQMAAIKLNPANMQATVQAIEKTWNELYPDNIFHSAFVDDITGQFYLTEKILLALIQAFSLVAILIGCLGLYGLVTFMAEAKTKEIGVRKVLGATVESIIFLLTKDFLKLITIAILIATPLAWLGMNRWLEGFPYHISIQWWMLMLAAGGLILLALASVSFQSVRAALKAPARSLNVE
ncbi:MAG TPA: FtsX-like permease family protein, partial [Chitinophaga sp.]|nr:FtsX-like permease family protein [Chitinophaga sp.]